MNADTDHITHPGAPEEQDRAASVIADRFATVLQVVPALGGSGGVERGTIEIASAVTAAGGRAIVASAGGALAYELSRHGAEHVELPVHSKNPVVMWKNIGRLAKLIRDERVDIVHARSRAPAWSALQAAKTCNVPFVTTFHGTYSRGNWIKRAYNGVMTKGERVICISDFIAGHVRRYYGVPIDKIRVIHRGVDLMRFDQANISAERVITLANEWRITDGRPVVMLPGRLTRWKGQTVFIEAIAMLARKDIVCLLVGSDQGRQDYRAELEASVIRHGLGDVVRIVDHCNDMPAAYMLTDVMVSASTDPEAFGRVIAEAQALGRPVIASDHGGAKETIIENQTGWLVPPGDATALAATIDRVLSLSADERDKLSKRAIAQVRENFSKDDMCRKTLDVYNEILAARTGA